MAARICEAASSAGAVAAGPACLSMSGSFGASENQAKVPTKIVSVDNNPMRHVETRWRAIVAGEDGISGTTETAARGVAGGEAALFAFGRGAGFLAAFLAAGFFAWMGASWLMSRIVQRNRVM